MLKILASSKLCYEPISSKLKKFFVLIIDVTTGTTECTTILRHISREELVMILPDSWITNYDKLRDYHQYLQSTDNFGHSYFKKPHRTTSSIHLYKPSNDLSDEKNLRTILSLLTNFIREYVQIRYFNYKGCILMWCRCPFSWHYLWKTNCDYKTYHGDDAKPIQSKDIASQTKRNPKPHILMISPSISRHIIDFTPNQQFS